MTVVAIAVDRVLIVTSSKALPDGLLRVYVMVAIAWFIGTLISLAPATDVLSSIGYISEIRHCTIKLEVLKFRVVFSIFLFGFMIPTLVASYSVVVYTLWRQNQNLKECQISGRRGRSACSDSKGEGIETSMYTESKPNSASNLSGEYNDKSLDQSDGESLDALDKGIHDDAFEKGEKERPHVSFPREAGNKDRVVFHNRKESSTSLASNSLEVSKPERYNQTDRKALAKQTKKEKRSLRVKKRNYIIQRRVSIMGGLLVLVITLCWTPYVILRTLQPDIKDSVYVFAMWLAYCITVIDPVIYAFMNQRARKELIKYKNMIFSKMCSK
ncbi:alpha-2C adrenergic receptor-like [Strongylocentrotus purpuratus]|uniref:G-protein coupled receptors family 1 profile domain-containing protein n=1 Tax=Strongylocentrotus purpuratus TaxID=7668 RepID=A0A7M7PFJ7_STRPU|nr:alpha-2C adrenergic receptor-like [Strongylocentrotus purpuratus]